MNLLAKCTVTETIGDRNLISDRKNTPARTAKQQTNHRKRLEGTSDSERNHRSDEISQNKYLHISEQHSVTKTAKFREKILTYFRTTQCDRMIN